jgi:hypothetical protein
MAEPTGKLHKSVLGLLRSWKSYGGSDWEIENALGLTHQSASARRRELVLRGLVHDSGLKRMGGSRRKVTVWVAPEPKAKKKP